MHNWAKNIKKYNLETINTKQCLLKKRMDIVTLLCRMQFQQREEKVKKYWFKSL